MIKVEVKTIIINADGQKAAWDGSIITPEREIPPPATEPFPQVYSFF
ncbi:hypothetical protein [Nostoc sp.]